MKQWLVTLFSTTEGVLLISSDSLITERAVRNYFLGAVKTIVPFTQKSKI